MVIRVQNFRICAFPYMQDKNSHCMKGTSNCTPEHYGTGFDIKCELKKLHLKKGFVMSTTNAEGFSCHL